MNNFRDARLLLVDDEDYLITSMYKFLKNKGYDNVMTAKNIKEASFKLKNNKVDLMILDIMLPDGSGFDLLEKLREKSTLPVIILSALSGIDDKKVGFNLEVDDYIVKPFLPEDLLWRIEAVLRRTYQNKNNKITLLGGIVFDRERAVLIKNKEEIQLTAKQFKILDYLAININKIVSIDQIIDRCWEESFGYENTLITHIYRLRDKLEDDPANPKILITVKGLGYKLLGENKEC
ncbi:response regulator transcription factor [Peptoniphilus grossensis]|uniref:response regulator transcription factor n=1 Tax=Peptoniphilus grossensis TaxID=1465756 RepID=UPI00258C8F8A|nr:response regulator transcription factor [Peptoniphilus grossensis]MDU5099873.1 response regulator transcription factor [Peptoniphilus grossensis]